MGSEALEMVNTVAHASAWAAETPQRPHTMGWTEWVEALKMQAAEQTQLRLLRLASPLEIAAQLPAIVATSVPAVATVFYIAKRAWGLDLEFRAHREGKRVEFLEAKERAKQLLAQSQQGAKPADIYVEQQVTELRERSHAWQLVGGQVFDGEDVGL
jgi:hypothetical protein